MSGRRSLLLALAVALVAGAPSVAGAQFPFGDIIGNAKRAKQMGDALRSIGEDEEIKMGGDLASIILGAAPLVDNPAEQHYVNRLGRWLASHSERPNLPWKFGIIDTEDFNAFSMPGGYVLISRGLFDRMRNESELAGVLSHEIAHVVRKHHLKALQKSMGSSALTGLGKSYLSSKGGVAGQLSGKLLESGRQMFIKGLDKDDEYEADRMGVVIAARSGYSPYGLVGVIQTLASVTTTEKGFALLMKTHPAPADRLDRLDNAMAAKLDAVPGLVDDLPSFVQLRAPPAPIPAAKPARPAARKGKGRT
jgi:predicted Zn-dependent protease